VLRSHPTLSLNELNWPSDEQRSGTNAIVYQANAQLFVHELLRLKDGPACLARMLHLLPQYLNWQTAFLRAFEPHFQHLLDVDKWWSLNVVHISSREMMFTWTREEAMIQLDEALIVPAQVRLRTNDLPMIAPITLQQVLSEWTFDRQNPILLQKIQILHNLRIRAPLELMGLVDHYRATLEAYLRQRQQNGEGPFSPQPVSNDRALAHEAIKRLNELDAKRQALHSPTNNAVPPQLSRTR
jgi:hypothetical protein